MAKTTEKLSPWKIKALTEPGRYSDGGNLFLVVRPSGTKTWSFLFRWTGKPTEAGGGSINSVGLKEARRWAAEGRAMLHESPPRNPKDVWQELKRASQTPTFAEMAELYLEGKSSEWRSAKHRHEVQQLLRRDCKPIANKRVNEISTSDVLHTVKLVHKRAPVQAVRLRERIEQVLAGAQALNHIDPNLRNPATWRGNLDKLLPERPRVAHWPALPYTELPQFMTRLRALRNVDGVYNIAAYALELAILTAARSGEARGMRWAEIDLERRLWTLPAHRMKEHRPHIVPLSDGAVAIIEAMQEIRSSSEFVFPGISGRKPIASKRFDRLRRQLQCAETAHGFRSAFRDWGGNETTHDRETIEVALSHVVGSQTERSYRRSVPVDKHRALMLAWDNYLADKPTNVTALRRPRKRA